MRLNPYHPERFGATLGAPAMRREIRRSGRVLLANHTADYTHHASLPHLRANGHAVAAAAHAAEVLKSNRISRGRLPHHAALQACADRQRHEAGVLKAGLRPDRLCFLAAGAATPRLISARTPRWPDPASLGHGPGVGEDNGSESVFGWRNRAYRSDAVRITKDCVSSRAGKIREALVTMPSIGSSEKSSRRSPAA